MIVTLQTLLFFRESLFTAVERLLRPYFTHFLNFNGHGNISDDEESEDQVFAEFHDEKGVVFYPPMYAQRYAAVSDCLIHEQWCGKLEKVVDLGFHDMSFIKYLKEIPGVKFILGVDIDNIPLRCTSDLLGRDEYSLKRENPLKVTLYQGNAADPDYRLIGCDAVIAIEMIEHMLPHDLERLVHTVFGFIKPRIAVFTTPNSDFNELFKALEINGLRRLDHFFEWSREQFNDWCSNIVARYPQYTVNCQGIGPGPPGTEHLGCCSQLALFISKDYHKQQDLGLHSLAMVAKNAKQSNDLSELIENLDNSDYIENYICSPNELNCTTLQVKKFSKTTQNMMAKNKIDTLVHTREVVDEIRHLTKMLNFSKDAVDRGLEKGNWCNINWGDNAPYWNQYYKIIKEFSYPFEEKSEESRVLDLISDEINRLIDMQYDEDFSVDVNKLEIPLDRLMDLVQHITDDVDRVKDLLEWNGYEVVDNMVIYSRLVIDNVPVSQNDWPDDTVSDFDTNDIHSTTASESSIVLPDYYGRCLRRALDNKIRKLRSMLIADEDISAELDKVMCRLMKLALKTSRGRQAPPPSIWMQCKLFDLLSLTEKAIERRKRHFIENHAFNNNFGYQSQKTKDIIAIANNQEDDFVDKLVNKYRHLVQSYESKENNRKLANECAFDFFQEDDSDARNKLMQEQKYFNDDCANIVNADTITDSGLDCKMFYNEDETKLQRVQAWVDDDVEVVPYPNHDVNDINSGDTDNSFSYMDHHGFKKSSRKPKVHVAEKDKTLRRKKENYNNIKYDTNISSSKSKLFKKLPKKKSSYYIVIKRYKNRTSSASYESYKINNKRKYRNHHKLQSNMPKPIPETLIRLCSPEKKNENKIEQIQCSISEVLRNDIPHLIIENINKSATEDSHLIDIVTEDTEEIALHRTIGTDAEDTMELEQETILNSIINVTKEDERLNNPHDNVQSQTIFLYDINEPSTSKGQRHISMDVQCGPDVTINSFPALSAATSFTKIPKSFTTGIIENLFTNIRTQKSTEFGTSTDDCHVNCKTMSPRTRSVGIKIEDSNPVIFESYTMTECLNNFKENSVLTDTQLIKDISSGLRTKHSCSEFSESVEDHRKSPSQYANSSTNTSDICTKSSINKEIIAQIKPTSTKYICSKLCRGGVHVHSYKDQQESTDVLFLGQWQRCKQKAPAKKKNMYNSGMRKKVSDKLKKTVNSEEKLQGKKPTKFVVKIEQKKPSQKLVHMRARNAALDKMKEGAANNKKNIFNSLVKSEQVSRNVTKVTPKLTRSSVTCKNIKSVSAQKRPAVIITTVPKMECSLKNKLYKNYIPKYLKRNKAKLVTNEPVLNQCVESFKTVIKDKTIKQVAPSQKSITADIKKQLLRFPDEPRDNISIIVFRNDTSNNKNTTDGELSESNREIVKKKDSSSRRTYSPQSQNSSTGSSPNSIATVRAARPKMISTRKSSTSPNIENINYENITLLRNKKFTKKIKPGKNTNDKNLENKENIPESSIQCNKDKIALASFVGANKSVYRAQVTTESGPLQNALNSLSKHKSQTPIKSNMNFSNTDAKRSVNITLSGTRTSLSPVISALKMSSNKMRVLTSEVVGVQEIQDDFDQYSQTENTLNNTIFTDIKHLVEERLVFIENESDKSLDSETEILSREDLQKPSLYENRSPASFKSIITNKDVNSSLRYDIENAMNSTYDSILVDELATYANSTDVIIPDFDLHSFESITTAASGMSEYFLADTELNDNEVFIQSETSVQDIFEMKDQLQIQNTSGSLANQAFSGFSMNVEPAGIERLDPVNFTDSETGSMALRMARQTISEELFTSGRSSGTYETCFIDEDAVLPYWLFQDSGEFVDEEEPDEVLAIPLPVPLPEHMFDGNGNILPEVGAGTGAGDGRGMHSDNSQDSSGHGTSTSSSEPSSGVQSEAILIDPSALAIQFEMMREAVDNADAPPLSASIGLTDTSYNASEAGEHNDDMSTSRNGRRNPGMPPATSDMDADVSSLDTDVLDSSDN